MIANLVESLRDNRVGRVELQSALVCVDGVRHLVVARFVQRAEVVPHFGEVRVNANCPRVGIERVVVLVDVVVQHPDRAPERRILPVAIDCLLVSLVRLAKIVRRHVRPAEQVPREGIVRICDERESVLHIEERNMQAGDSPDSSDLVKICTDASGS